MNKRGTFPPQEHGGRTSGETKERRTSEREQNDTARKTTVSWEVYGKIERLAFRCAEQDTSQGQDLDPQSMTRDQVKELVPSDRSVDKLLEFTRGKPSATVVNLFLGAYRQRLVELLEEGQAAAGLCVETDCRREVKRLGDHTFRRCPEHMTGRLRELGRK